MRYIICLLGFILILVLPGCHARVSENEAVATSVSINSALPLQDSMTFEAAFSKFFTALQAHDTATLNTFIHPQRGFWLIEQPGALPAYTHFGTIQDVKREFQGRPFTSLSNDIQVCDLVMNQNFPEFDCALLENGASGFTEDGCFYASDTMFKKNDMWQYASLTPQQQQQVQALQQLVQFKVLHTATSFRFYFGYEAGKWRLYFADLRVPCSA